MFVVDGEPSELKAWARMDRFLKDVDASEVLETILKKRNGLFVRYMRECVEFLELLGMPFLQACSEAEALCAQLNNEGHVDACIAADSDAFLFGTNCVIKCFQSNSKEPFECYHMSDVEDSLGFLRKQMVAIALLVGNDYDLGDVSGFGVDEDVGGEGIYGIGDGLDEMMETMMLLLSQVIVVCGWVVLLVVGFGDSMVD